MKLSINKFFKKYKKINSIALIRLAILNRENRYNTKCSALWLYKNSINESFILGQFEETIWNLGYLSNKDNKFEPNYIARDMEEKEYEK